MSAIWRPMTKLEQEACEALGRVNYVPGTASKRLGKALAGQARMRNPQITDKQADAMLRMLWTFRRQIHNAELLKLAERNHQPQHYN